MKKLLVLLTVVCLLFSFAACKEDKKNTESETEVTSSQGSEKEENENASAVQGAADSETEKNNAVSGTQESRTDTATQPDGTVVEIQDFEDVSSASGSSTAAQSGISSGSSSKEETAKSDNDGYYDEIL